MRIVVGSRRHRDFKIHTRKMRSRAVGANTTMWKRIPNDPQIYRMIRNHAIHAEDAAQDGVFCIVYMFLKRVYTMWVYTKLETYLGIAHSICIYVYMHSRPSGNVFGIFSSLQHGLKRPLAGRAWLAPGRGARKKLLLLGAALALAQRWRVAP